MKQIVGILLIKNEDLHIEWVIRNIFDFCDHIIVLDNNSTDDTYAIVERLAAAADKIDLRKWKNPRDSQRVLAGYYGTDTWVFGVDGDSVYDPVGLAALRNRIFAGEFDRVWRLRGNFLNCVSLDFAARSAEGYPGPPASSFVMLFNFQLIRGWVNGHRKQRLHGHPIFAEDQSEMVLFAGNLSSWADSQLKCLHLCFVQRSSSPKFKQPFKLKNLKGRLFGKPSTVPHKHARPGPKLTIKGKTDRYAYGEIATRDITAFLGHRPEGFDDHFTVTARSLGEQLRQGGNLQLPAELRLANGEKIICTERIQTIGGRAVLKGQWRSKSVLIKFMLNDSRSAHNMRREREGYRILTALKIRTPELYFAERCGSGHILVFEFLDAQPLKDLWESSPHRRAEIADFGIDLFLRLHRRGYRHIDFHLGNFMAADGGFYVIDVRSVRKASRSLRMRSLLRASKKYGMWQRENLAQCFFRAKPPLYNAMMDALKRKYPEAANDAKLEPAIIAMKKSRAERRATSRIRRLLGKAGFPIRRGK